MKERPILMTAENAQKCHDGTKTMTRRIVKLTASGRVKQLGSPKNWHLDDANCIQACPYGVVGDRLWIRETWCQDSRGGKEPAGQDAVYYRGAMPDSAIWQGSWKPSIHMPRWACRTVLEIVSVKVERLQEISKADAKAEGCVIRDVLYADEPRESYSYVDRFRLLWESIHGPGSWGINPRVWVIAFRRAS